MCHQNLPTTQPLGYLLTIFVPDCDPEGLKIIEKSNWNGVDLSFPRSALNKYEKREELEKPGLYILKGLDETNNFPKIYIGEGDPIIDRLKRQKKEKEFWTDVIAFTSILGASANGNKVFRKE
jgi:hypothetical protein